MIDNRPTTWWDVRMSVDAWARYGWQTGEFTCMDDIPQWAEETADGCEFTIYYHHQNDLWGCDEVTKYEDDTYERDDIQTRIQHCVFIAIREACVEAALSVMEDPEESYVATAVMERFCCVGGQYMTIPVLDLVYKPRRSHATHD